ncbi:MAG: protein kinase [Bradymonadaceae bacterium]|nr:protein kinase [Lujinxingiaceae bacterium]
MIAEKYRLEEVVGSGGFSSVFRAKHVAMDRTVAVKIFDPSESVAGTSPTSSSGERFQREARLLSQLTHAHTIRIFDFGQEPDGLLYLVMEYVVGASLRQYIRSHGAIDAERVANMAIQTLGSIDEAHHRGILHRDLKTDNLILTTDYKDHEIVKVLDFGIAKLVEKPDISKISAGLTGDNFVGTPRYASPEQLRGDDLTFASDIYGIGMVMWEALVGKPAVEATGLVGCVQVIFAPEPFQLPEAANVPRGLAEIVHRAVSKEASKRYQSCAQMRAAIEAYLRAPQSAGLAADLAPDMAATVLDIKDLEFDEDAWMPGSRHAFDPNYSDMGDDLSESFLGNSFDPDGTEQFDVRRPGPSSPTPATRHTPAPSPSPRRPSVEAHDSIDFGAAESDQGGELELDLGAFDAHRSNAAEMAQQPSRDSRSGAQRTQPHLSRPELRAGVAGSKQKPVAMAVGALGIVVALGVGFFFLNRDVSSDGDSQVAVVEPDEPVAEVEVVALNPRFDEQGILTAIQRAGWRMAGQTASNSLSNLDYQAFTFSSRDATIDVTVFTAHNEEIARNLATQTTAPARHVLFDHRLVRLTPRQEKGDYHVVRLQEQLQRYHGSIAEAR